MTDLLEVSIIEEARAFLNEIRPAKTVFNLPAARELARFEMGGDLLPVPGVLFYAGGPEKGLKSQCYVNENTVVALKPKKITKVNAEGFAVGSYVLKVAWHGPVSRVKAFTAA